MARSNAGRIVIVILRPRRRDLYKIRTILRWGASAKRCREGRALTPAEQSSLQLLIASKPGQIHGCCRVSCEWNGTRNQTAVITPVETEPWSPLPGLILQMGGLVEFLVVIDAENTARGRWGGSSSTDLG